MAETKKCPKCGGTIHNKIGGMYICSQCGSAIAESDVIFDSGSSNAGSQSSGSDWSYTSFENESSGPEQTATEGKDWGYRSFESEPEKKNEKPKKAPKVKKEKVRKEKKKTGLFTIQFSQNTGNAKDHIFSQKFQKIPMMLL